MNLELDDKVVLITGASRGIGKAIAKELAANGALVAICGRTTESLNHAAAEINPSDRQRVWYHAADITRSDAAAEFVDLACRTFGRVDVAISNVGGNRRKNFLQTTDQDWLDLLELNLLSGLRFAREAIPRIQDNGCGAVLFVSSLFGREAGGAGLSMYNATKSAIISAAKIMAIELAPMNIRVNTIAPGSIRFPGGSWDQRVQADPEGMASFVASNLPLGRFGTAEEVAALAAFLVSPRASLITGACIAVDGSQGRSLI